MPSNNLRYTCSSASLLPVIQALTKASGLLGLEAFLPSPYRSVPTSPDAPPFSANNVPHLSMEARWQDGDFRAQSVMGASTRDVNVREWTLRLLERYRFVVGAFFPLAYDTTAYAFSGLAYTPYAFVMLETVENAEGALGWIDSYRDASLLCINDDVREGEEEVSDMFRDWQDTRWGRPATWERIPAV